MGEGSLSQDDIDALLSGSSGSTTSGTDALANLDALVGGGGGGGGGKPDDDDGPSFADIAAALGPSSTPTSTDS